MTESMSTIFSYDDAVRVVREVLDQLREERDAQGPDESGFYRNWDRYHAVQERLDEVARLAGILNIEPAVQNFLLKSYEREDVQ